MVSGRVRFRIGYISVSFKECAKDSSPFQQQVEIVEGAMHLGMKSYSTTRRTLF